MADSSFSMLRIQSRSILLRIYLKDSDAARRMARAQLDQRYFAFPALIAGVFAPRREPASRRQVQRIRHDALDRAQPPLLFGGRFVEARDGAQQTFGVRVPRADEQFARRGFFDDLDR